VFLTALTIIFDGFDNQLLGVALPTIMREWSVTRGAFAPVVSLGYLGMMIGGTLAGYAGDRIGRRNALLWCLAVFGIATVVVATLDDVRTLGILRLIAGVGLGGAMPNAAALAGEYVPLRQRPFAVTLAIVCVPLGATLAGFAAIAALPTVGWRGLFVIGGVTPIVGAILLTRLMPESPRYLVRHPSRWRELAALLRRMGHAVPDQATFVPPVDSAASRPSLASIFGRALRVDTFALWGAFFSCLLAVYLGFAWLPTILTGAGLPSSVASTGLTAFNLGGVVGALVGGKLLTRFGSRIIMVSMTAGAVVCALVMSRMSITAQSAVLPILVMLTLTGGLINAVQTTMFALAAHVYPTAIRAGGVGTVVAFGRLGAILVGYAGPWALEYRGSESFFWLMAAALVVTCVSLATVRRHVPARS
jgi:AAHS family 4-hydroxybenzoate transporter-like MFS transporter